MPASCPRSSLPAKVLTWLAGRLADLNPPRRPGQGGTRPLVLEVRLDAVAAVILDGLSYRRAGRMVGISKTEVGDSLDLLLGPLADLGFCQPDGTFVTGLGELGERLAEMARSGEAVCVDGLATRVQRPRSWANQKVLYDAKRHTHTAQGLAVSTIWGDLLWVDGGWPGCCHGRTAFGSRPEIPRWCREGPSPSVPGRRSCPCCTGASTRFGCLAPSRRERALDRETSWSEPVPEVVQGRAGRHVFAHRRGPGSADHGGNALVRASLPIAVAGGTGNAWATPQAAETPRRLVLWGGLAVVGASMASPSGLLGGGMVEHTRRRLACSSGGQR